MNFIKLRNVNFDIFFQKKNILHGARAPLEISVVIPSYIKGQMEYNNILPLSLNIKYYYT
jgi:hypothetical protein